MYNQYWHLKLNEKIASGIIEVNRNVRSIHCVVTLLMHIHVVIVNNSSCYYKYKQECALLFKSFFCFCVVYLWKYALVRRWTCSTVFCSVSRMLKLKTSQTVSLVLILLDFWFAYHYFLLALFMFVTMDTNLIITAVGIWVDYRCKRCSSVSSVLCCLC